MSAPKFTPGPWLVHPRFAYVVPAEHADRPIGGAEDDAYDLAHFAQEVCALHHPDRHRGEDESLANGFLIAAAPELYGGCNAMLGLVQLILGRDDLSAELREVLTTNHRIAEAEAATAKARGEAL